jgi:hypothetical protein
MQARARRSAVRPQPARPVAGKDLRYESSPNCSGVGIDIKLTYFHSLVQMSKPIEYFYKNLIKSSSGEESGGKTELLFTAARMAHDHYLLLKRKGGSSVKRKANKDRDRVGGGHAGLMRGYFHPTNPVYDAKTSVLSDVQKFVYVYSPWCKGI